MTVAHHGNSKQKSSHSSLDGMEMARSHEDKNKTCLFNIRLHICCILELPTHTLFSIPTSNMSSAETMKATADAWLTGFKNWDVEALVAPRADDCIHEIYPTTLEIPPSTNADFRAFFEPLKSFQVVKVRFSPDREQTPPTQEAFSRP